MTEEDELKAAIEHLEFNLENPQNPDPWMNVRKHNIKLVVDALKAYRKTDAMYEAQEKSQTEHEEKMKHVREEEEELAEISWYPEDFVSKDED